jgi:hypothetical protein
MKNKKYHTVETVPKSNRTIVERGKIDVFKTYTSPLTCLDWYWHCNKKVARLN